MSGRPQGRTIDGALNTVERNRPRKYTAKQKKFLKIYAQQDFRNPRQAAVLAGYSEDRGYKVAAELKEDIIEISKDLLLANAPGAAATITDLMESNEILPNANIKLQAAKEVLDRVGVVKPEKVEHDHKVTGGLFFLPMKQEIVYQEVYLEEEEEDIEGEYEYAQ